MTREIDPALSRYITMAQHVPQLSREEELELAQRWCASQDSAAAERLVRAHLRYVVAIALKYRRYGLPLTELIAEGNFGVVHALKKFEPDRGNRFVTYAAYWIRAYILNYIIRSWSLVGVGSGALRSKMFFKLRRERVRITNLVGEGDHADELLAAKFNMTRVQVMKMVRRLEARDVSLDSKVFDDSMTSLVDTLVSPDRDQEESFASTQVKEHMTDAVRCAIETLDPRERYIVEKRLMADGEEELSLAEIGRRLGVSRERARQLEARAKRKLKTRISELSKASGADWLDDAMNTGVDEAESVAA
jgi:RNA polymerase sigma-32 factor